MLVLVVIELLLVVELLLALLLLLLRLVGGWLLVLVDIGLQIVVM
jgi:hypothetical protein